MQRKKKLIVNFLNKGIRDEVPQGCFIEKRNLRKVYIFLKFPFRIFQFTLKPNLETKSRSSRKLRHKSEETILLVSCKATKNFLSQNNFNTGYFKQISVTGSISF